MKLSLREPTAADAPTLGEICYQAFKAVAEAHNYPPDLPSAEAATGLISGLIAGDGTFGVVAESGGRVIGSNFLDERGPISGVGPVTVDPKTQNAGVGRALMAAVIERSQARGFVGIRLVQAGYHLRSLSLYLSLGFEAREHLSCLQGPAIGEAIPGAAVRPATAADPAVNSRVLIGHQGTIKRVEISPDSRWAVTCSTDRIARVWDLAAESPAANPRVLGEHHPTSVALSADGRCGVPVVEAPPPAAAPAAAPEPQQPADRSVGSVAGDLASAPMPVSAT